MMPWRQIGDQFDELGESPVWSVREQALYWVDIRGPAVRRWTPASGRFDRWPMPALVGSVALVDDGRLLVALPRQVALFDLASGQFETLAEPPSVQPEQRFNDGRCDRRGRFWVGTMNHVTRAPEGSLYRLDSSADIRQMLNNLCIPNGLAWSPDERTMYFADSLGYQIFAYDFDAQAGTFSNGRSIARTVPPAIPDGATVDCEGFLWSAEYDGWRVVRYAPDGRIDRTISLPVQRPTSCSFGGPDLDRLYVTSATQKLSAQELAAQPLAGALFEVDAGVRGLPEPLFAIGRPAQVV